jgi:L-asparaginase / beta-aspartyl-peptidase
VATSTGGTPDKWPGRVGDSPLVGCGAYADDAAGAAAATGSGESLMKIVTSKGAVELMAAGRTAQEAADAIVARLWERVRGYGGVILIDPMGRVGLAHNTPNLAYAYVLPDGTVAAGVEFSPSTAPGRAEGLAAVRDDR